MEYTMNMPGGSAKQREQAGMVSILVTMIMMIVITLIIIGISEVTRSNQREQLNSQLSTQAYYAAESGLDQAVKFFNANPTAAINTTNPTADCTRFITDAAPNGLGGTVGGTNVLDSATNVSYTCLMVNSTPPSLQKAPLTQDSNTVWHVKDAAGNPFTQLEFAWKPSSNTQFTGAANKCLASAGFTAYANWNCAFGILRVDFVDVHGTVATSNLNGLEGINASKALYLIPVIGGGVNAQGINNLTTDAADVIKVRCTTGVGSVCDIKLTALPGSSDDYFMRLSMIYQDSDSVTLTGREVGGKAQFSGGQAVIDVTGKAQDELRRVQARVPLNISNAPIPNFALQTTGDLCKQLGVAPGLDTKDACP